MIGLLQHPGEHQARKLVAGSLFLLAGYVFFDAISTRAPGRPDRRPGPVGGFGFRNSWSTERPCTPARPNYGRCSENQATLEKELASSSAKLRKCELSLPAK